VARWIRLRIRDGRGLQSYGLSPQLRLTAAEEFVVSYADAAILLERGGTRSFEVAALRRR